MKRQILITVQNISNDTEHFKRLITIDSSIKVPYNQIVDSLLWLFQPMNVKVVIEQADV